jgi:general secretion pathway protein D
VTVTRHASLKEAIPRILLLALVAAAGPACMSPARRVVTPPPQVPRPPATSPAPGGPEAAPPGALPGPAPAGPDTAGVPTPPGPLVQAPAPPARPPAAPARPGRQIVLNFDNADIEAVIQAASEIVGFNYTLGPGVQGKKVTVQTSGRIPEDEVFNVLLAVLEVHGVTAIRSGNLYKVIPAAAARERPVPTVIGAQPDPTRRDDEIITQIIPVTHAPADRIAGTLRPFVQGGNVVVQGNLLIVTDTASNIVRVLQIVAVLDVEAAQDELRILPVRYADAVEMAKVLNDFFAGRRVRTAGAAGPLVPAVPRPGVAAAPPAGGGEGDRPPLILADKRTNALIVSARRPDLEMITKLLGQLDVDTQANKRVFVYYVENVKAKELAATLTEIFGKPAEGAAPPRRDAAGGPLATVGLGVPAPVAAPATAPSGPGASGTELEPGVVEGQVRVVADEPNNALIVTTFPRNWPLIEDTIRKLDRTPKQVLIEVLVAEIGLDDENRLGLEWTLRTQQNVKVGSQSYNVGSVARVDVGPPSTLPGQTPTPTLAGLPVSLPATAGFSLFLFETDRFLGLLNLYANYGKLNVLSSPHILTSENKKAVINVSDSVPIVTQQVSSQTGTVVTQNQEAPTNVLTQSVEYLDAGIILTVTPRISDKRVVSLDVKQTVNNVGPPQPPSGSPVIIKREAETSVVLRDHQTLVLGGLIQTRQANTATGIPGLSRIPIVGFLFGATGSRVQRTELLILITPRVVGDPAEAQDVYRQIVGQRPGLQQNLRGHPSLITPETAEALPPPVPTPVPASPPTPPLGGSTNER